MANPFPNKEHQFKPGQSGNPSGKPRGLLTRSKVEAVMGKFSELTRAELQDVVQDPKSTMLEIMVASVMAQAAKSGDAARLAFLLDRSIGRVKEAKNEDEEREQRAELSRLTREELISRARELLPELKKEPA